MSDREPHVDILVSMKSISFLFDTGATYSVLREFGGPPSPFHPPLSGWGAALPASSYLTTQLHFQWHSSHSLIFRQNNLFCPLTGKVFSVEVGASIYFAPHICLILDLPAAPSLLLFLATHPTDSNMFFPLLTSQVNPQVWDTQNPSLARHHSLIVIQLQDLSSTLPKPSTHSHSRALRDINLSTLTS